MAAEQGNADAQSNIGFLYRNGQGVPHDFGTAYMWFSVSLANGLNEASDERDITAQSMTPADISEAQRRARVCIASGYKNCD